MIDTLIKRHDIHNQVLWSENPTDADLSAAAAVVVCVGEGAYAEKPGDIDDAALPVEQVQEVMRIAQAVKGKPLVGVLLEGRPRVLQGIPQMTDAFVHAMLPGPAGGRAIADILLGLVVRARAHPHHQALTGWLAGTMDGCLERSIGA